MVTTLLVTVFLCCIGSLAHAEIRFDRMHVACNGKPASCILLLEQIQKDLHFAELVQKGSSFSQLWVKTMMSAHSTITQLKQEFPGVWEAQDCPVGDCRTQNDLFLAVPKQDTL
jgi:hypothetical protein